MSIELSESCRELLSPLLQIPPDLRAAEELLQRRQYSEEDLASVALEYAEECFMDVDSVPGAIDFPAEYMVDGLNSTYLYKVIELLLYYGLQPNTIIGDNNIMNVMSEIDNGYIAADTTALLCEHGGNPRGVDIWAAEIVLKLRNEGFSIRLICASPFEGFERSWSSDWQMRYQAILNNADLVRYVCPNYSSKCFQIRNEWMVNHSARVIAVYNGEPGGTRNTVCYAKMHGVDVVFACS